MRLLFVLLLGAMAFGGSSALAKGRGINVAVKDGAGEQVALYYKSHALVIGVSDYDNGWPKLRGVREDIPAVKAALEKQGFAVTVVMDPDREGLDKAFRDFVNRHGGEPENRLLFYFAGHGHSMQLGYGGVMGYLVGRDAPNPHDDKMGFKSKALSMEVVETYARNIESKHALFLFDSCFSGSIFDATRAIPDVIQVKTGMPVRQFITSGSAEQQVPDKSIFRRQFVEALNGEGDRNGDGYVTGSELGSFLESKVTNYSRQSQTPQYGKLRDPLLDKGDFVFVVPGTAARKPASAPISSHAPGGGPDKETVFWQSIQASDDPDMFEAYLEQYPNGSFAPLARAKVKKLARAQAVSPAPAPSRPAERRPALASTAGGGFRPGDAFKDCETCPEMVVIPSGRFRMGDLSGGGDGDENPVRGIAIDRAFAVGKYEVTQAEYRSVMGGDNSMRKGARRPVEMVSWNDAKAFVRRLSERTGKQYRLLSEAEWEYVARAGSSTRYWWGETASREYANYGKDEGDGGFASGRDRWTKSSPVGSFAPSRFGVHDMTGNVWEWVEDCYRGRYSDAPAPENCKARVRRGGSWYSNPADIRSANRYKSPPGYRSSNLGLRVARTLP